MAHALKACGQHVLEEALQELGAGQPQGFDPTIGAVLMGCNPVGVGKTIDPRYPG